MSGCKVCHVPLRVGYRSGNNIDVDRIRTGNMTCYSCLPNPTPPNPNLRFSGTCVKCKEDLLTIRDVSKGDNNTSVYRIRNKDFVCFGCRPKKRSTGIIQREMEILKTKCRRGIRLYRDLKISMKEEEKKKKKEWCRQEINKRFSSGIYGIWFDDRLIYVGESKSVISRIFDGHFRLLEVLPSEYRVGSPIPHILTKENKHRFKWGYIHKEEDLTKRLIIENQYVSMYTPRYNHPYKNLPDNEYESLVVSLEGRDVGTFTLEVDEYYPVSIRKIKGEIMKDYHKYVSIKSTP